MQVKERYGTSTDGESHRQMWLYVCVKSGGKYKPVRWREYTAKSLGV